MKRPLTTLILCLLATTSLLAQGRICFANTSATAIRISNCWPYWGSTGPWVTNIVGTDSVATFGIGPASVRVRLYAGLSSSSMSPVLIGTGADQEYVLNTSSVLASFQGTFAGGANLPLAGFDGSDPVFLRFTAESINGQYFGSSSLIQVVPTLSPQPATLVFSTTADSSHWDGILFLPIPEPSSFGVLLLGAGLFVCRRWQVRR